MQGGDTISKNVVSNVCLPHTPILWYQPFSYNAMTNPPAAVKAPARGALVTIAPAVPAWLLDNELSPPPALDVQLAWSPFPLLLLSPEDDVVVVALVVVEVVDLPLDDKLVAAACARLL